MISDMPTRVISALTPNFSKPLLLFLHTSISITCGLVYLAQVSESTMTKDWKEVKGEVKSSVSTSSIPKEWLIDAIFPSANVSGCPCDLRSPQQVPELTSQTSATDLVAKLADGSPKAVDVTTAFCKRAAISHQATNCALEFFPELAP